MVIHTGSCALHQTSVLWPIFLWLKEIVYSMCADVLRPQADSNKQAFLTFITNKKVNLTIKKKCACHCMSGLALVKLSNKCLNCLSGIIYCLYINLKF